MTRKKKQYDPKRTWFTSDLHFGHKNIMKFCPHSRPYCSVEDMDGTMIDEWNKRVQPGDDVFFLGDFAFHKVTMVEKILSVLNGNIHMIYGNHDQVIRNNKYLQDYFASIQEYLEIDHEGIKICMFHYPMAVWNKCHHGSIHLHGHSHSEHPHGDKKMLDVGWDTARKVFSLEEVLEIVKDREVAKHHKKDCKLTIVRGIPGAGKSTFVKTAMNPKDVEAHFESDMWFEKDGEYQFDVDDLFTAHKWCFDKVREALENEKNTVVSNTFVKPKDVRKYLSLARTLGVAVEIIDVRGSHESIHDVPAEILDKMKANFRKLDFSVIQEAYIEGNKNAKYSEKFVNTDPTDDLEAPEYKG